MNKKFFKVFSLSFVSFLLITILFNKIIPVYEVSSVRPSATLNPVLGLAYGWPAILGCSIANFVSDLISGYGILVAILGVGPQILYGLIPYLIWKKIEKSNSLRTRLDTPAKVVDYVLLMAVNSVIIGLAVGAIQFFSTGMQFWETAKFAALNDLGVCLVFGLPLITFLDFVYSKFKHDGTRSLSDNEKIILISSLCQLGVFLIEVIVVYIVMAQASNLEKWNKIYSFAVIFSNVILLLSICIMLWKHSNIKKDAGLRIINKKHGRIYVDTKKNLEFVSFPGEEQADRIKADCFGFKGKRNVGNAAYELGWYNMISNQKGCPMNCSFCDCPSFGFKGNVSRQEFAYQINTILDTHAVKQTKLFEIDFMRMGEPSLNDDLLPFIEFDLVNLVRAKIDAERIVPFISTMLPRNRKKVESFIKEFCRINNEVFNGQAAIQFSIHSSDDKVRNQLFNQTTMSLNEISEISKTMPTPKGIKYALDFAVGKDFTVDPVVIDKLFDKNKFLIKITPIHNTFNAVDHGFETMNNYNDCELFRQLEKDFTELGWDVMIYQDSKEEDGDDLTCGKLVLPSIQNDSGKKQKIRKRYGIIAALEFEEKLFRSQLQKCEEVILLNKPAYKGLIGDNEVIVMQCGMGKVSAGICAQAMIDKFHPDFIINTGCAGALNPNLKVGDVVLSESVVEWDLDLTEIGYPLGYIDALGCVEMLASKDLVDTLMKSKDADTNVMIGKIVSGDQFVSKKEQVDHIVSNFPTALCAEMEGAAIGHVCLQNKTPFCIIRAMSDTADGSSGVDFKTFAENSSKISSSWIMRMLRES